MRISYKTRKNISQVLSVVLLCALGFTAIFGVSALSNKLKEETKVIYPTFEVGGIGEDGKGNRDETGSIFNKESFECAGLEVKLDFDARVSYSVFYYDDMDMFISSDLNNTESKACSVPEGATHARIVVTPIWDKDVKTADRVCHWYDVTKYSSQLEIRVAKDQEPDAFLKELKDMAERQETLYLGNGRYNFTSGYFSDPDCPWHMFGEYDATGVDEVIIKVKTASLEATVSYGGVQSAMIIYDKDAKTQTSLATYEYEILHESGKYSYISLDTTTLNNFVISTDVQGVDGFEVWFVD